MVRLRAGVFEVVCPAATCSNVQWSVLRKKVLAATTVAFLVSLCAQWAGWDRFLSARRLQSEEEITYSPAHITRCRAARRPKDYGVITKLDPVMIDFCGEIPTESLLGSNKEVNYINFLRLAESTELLTIVREGGSVYQLNVISDGDTARWEVTRSPSRTLRRNSCLDSSQFCHVASATPYLGRMATGETMSGLVVVDRHRILQFNLSWIHSDSPEFLIASMGKMNMEAPALGISEMSFPSFVAMYQSLNSTHIGTNIAITPMHPHAGEVYLFVSDTGNHRILFLNVTDFRYIAYIESFGVAGVPMSNSTGFDSPMGLTVWSPGYETAYGPTIANLFIADRGNNRLVKLNLGYRRDPRAHPAENVTLIYSGEYFEELNGINYNRSLHEPIGVATFRHYIFVGEALGNVISLLTVDHVHHDKIIFVTHLYPARGYQLTGIFSTTSEGYLWFTYKKLPGLHGIGSIYLPEPIIRSRSPRWIDEFRLQCTNQTIYHFELMLNKTYYDEFVTYAMDAAGINWRFPLMPGYMSKDSFNMTPLFDLYLWNNTVLAGTMEFCQPPPPPTTPPMLSANEEGWNTPGSGGTVATAGSKRVSVQACITLLVSFLWIQLLVAGWTTW
eukprot:TRINITY_DN27975_c0_g2_i1.p1 TRINITY_DN27975_c0_g2~~TRINITY_DN27975_c0_g2_i1.p1  ORF type:complete len:616 (-),score=56.76 TRINITY_DN27975_c0_g2_i1:8-1855(-)